MLNSTFPRRLLCLVFLSGFTSSHKRVGEVVGGFLPELFIFREKRLREVSDGLVKFSQLVCCRAGIEMQGTRIRFGLESFFKSRISLLVLPLLVILNPIGASVAHGSREQKQGQQRHRERHFAASITRKYRKHQTQNRKTKWPLVAFNWLARSEDPILGEFHRLNAFLEYLFGRIGTDVHKKSSCGLSDFGQASGIQLGIHRFSRGITHEILPPILSSHRDKRSSRRTDPNSENPNPFGCGLLGGSDSIGIQLFSIG